MALCEEQIKIQHSTKYLQRSSKEKYYIFISKHKYCWFPNTHNKFISWHSFGL